MQPTGSSLLLVLALAAHAPAGAAADDPWLAEPVTRELASVGLADGSRIVAGALSGAPGGCSSRSRAFVSRLDAGGNELWRRGADGESPLFGEHVPFPAEHVVSGIVYGLAVDPATGLVAAAGEVLLAWENGPEAQLVAARGAFVVLLDGDGKPVAHSYLGALPEGPPPPATVDCQALCLRGEEAHGEQFGARDVAVDAAGGVVLTGWFLPGADGAPAERAKDFFVARYSPALDFLDWLATDGRDGHDCGLGVAAGPDGAVYVTGYGGFERDLLVAKYLADGTRVKLLYGDGAQDDEGLSVRLRPDGNVLVHGRLTEQCTLAGMTLGAAGKGQQDFSLLLDPDLEPIWAKASDPFDSAKSGSRKNLTGGHTSYPADFSVVSGDVGTGGLDELSASDDYYLHAYAGPAGTVEVVAYFAPEPEPVQLHAIRIEILTEHCYVMTLSVNGYDSDEFLTVGQRDVCPGDEPDLTFKVSPELSRELGVDGVPGVDPNQRLVVRFQLRFPPSLESPGTKASTAGVDASVDQISVDVDY